MAAMRTTLLLMLLFAAVATAQQAGTATRSVSCENKCPTAIIVNGVKIDAGVSATIRVAADLKLALLVVDAKGVSHSGTYSCPADVTALVVVYESLYVKVKVGGVNLIVGLVETLLGLVLGLLGPCQL